MDANELQATLKPCPFCGKPGERFVDNSGDHDTPVHGCRDCGEYWYGGETEWNTRPLEAALLDEIARLTSELEAERGKRCETCCYGIRKENEEFISCPLLKYYSALDFCCSEWQPKDGQG